MGRAKEIDIRVIPYSIATPFVKEHHYSGTVVNNSQVHFGAFLDDRLHGVMSYGPCIDKTRMIGLVKNTTRDGFLELNRLAFDDYLPRNSESYCIGRTLRMIKKNAPQVIWVVSFADGCQCGDGTIYRASNFILTGIKRNVEILELPDGQRITKLALQTSNLPRDELDGQNLFEVTGGTYSIKKYCEITGAKPLEGYQFRYVYFIDKSYRKYLTVPEIPFSKIDELKAGMYKGEKKRYF